MIITLLTPVMFEHNITHEGLLLHTSLLDEIELLMKEM